MTARLWLQPAAARQGRRALLPSDGIVRDDGAAKVEGIKNMASNVSRNNVLYQRRGCTDWGRAASIS